MGRSRGSSRSLCAYGYPPDCSCPVCERDQKRNRRSGTFNSTSFHDKPQRQDPSVINTYFNSGRDDGDNHGHVKYRNNPDGTTDYLYARDVEGNEYDV